ncbi:MAG: YHS domain-containing protein [Candidatus Bathyarchaeota archaeon]|nr:YHS domain-containing protein [Candidatus Bathyarchaeota archaeon]
MAKDPVCGMMVDEKTAKLKSDYEGKAYYFCNVSCKNTFDKNPAKFAKGSDDCHSGGCCCCGGH